jgi:hypothetical protein
MAGRIRIFGFKGEVGHVLPVALAHPDGPPAEIQEGTEAEDEGDNRDDRLPFLELYPLKHDSVG